MEKKIIYGKILIGDNMRGIYIHIPFCRKICNYCDFYKMVVSDKFKEKFTEYLIKDLLLTKEKFQINKINTIYIGGGTPSAMPHILLEKLFLSLAREFELNKLDEFTIEVNPEDINYELISLFKKYGVTRISIGVQTFNMNCYNILGRVTDYNMLKEKINILNTLGFDNYSFDLIYAVPNTSIEDLTKDLDKILSLNPKHISTYSLILEERTILSKKIEHDKIELITEELDLKMYDHIVDYLKRYDFTRYETSNFSRTGYESKHNLIYWNCDEYYGVGPAASSFVNNLRFTKVNDIKKYYDFIDKKTEPVVEYEYLDKRRFMEDYIMLGLRKTKGINVAVFNEKFNTNLFKEFNKIEELINENSILFENDFIKINEKYTYISNHIIGKILFG